MNCKDTGEVLDAYFDGELDLVRSLGVEQHLKDCPVCARAHREHELVRKALTSGPLYFNASKGLNKRVRSAVRHASRAEGRAESRRRGWNWSWPMIFSPIAAAALVLFVALPMVARRSARENLLQEIVSAHVRSLMADTSHLTDVASTDQHTVKPWFTGKLPFAPPVTDLSAQGFPLIGGRLDYIVDQPVAALVYQRRKHLINLFIWPAGQQTNSVQEIHAHQGYNLIRWTQGGMALWAVSDVNLADLREFVQLQLGKEPSR